MGSDFSKHICCVICGRCRTQEGEEANEETSETKPILQASGETLLCTDREPPSPALQLSKQVSEEVQALSQDPWPAADAPKVDMETCFAADLMTERWEAVWGSTEFLVALEDGDTKGEVEVLIQVENQQEREKMSNAEVKMNCVAHASEAQPVPHTAQGAKLATDKELPEEQASGAGSEGSPCAGIRLQERNTLNFMEFPSGTAAGQDCVIKPPVEAGESILGRNMLLCAVQLSEETETYLSVEQVEKMDRAKPAEISPQSAMRSEITPLVETADLLTVQVTQRAGETVDPLEAEANSVAEMYPTPTVPWKALYPEGEALEPAKQLFAFLQQDTQPGMLTAQEMEGLCWAEPADLSEAAHQSLYRVLGELEEKERSKCDAETAASEAEPQHRLMQQPVEIPGEHPACVQIPEKQEAESLHVAPSLSEEFGSSTETEVGNVEA